MKILLDENLPKRLKQNLQEFETFTVRDKGWNGKANGEIIKLMLGEGFNVLITFDKNLEHQQNFAKFPATVLALNAGDNTYPTLKELVPKIKQKLSEPPKIGVVEVKL